MYIPAVKSTSQKIVIFEISNRNITKLHQIMPIYTKLYLFVPLLYKVYASFIPCLYQYRHIDVKINLSLLLLLKILLNL